MWSSQTFSILLVLRRAWLKVHFPSPGPSQPRYRQTMFGAACSANFSAHVDVSAFPPLQLASRNMIKWYNFCVFAYGQTGLWSWWLKHGKLCLQRERFQNNHFPYNSAELLSASQLDEGTERVRKLTFLSHHDILITLTLRYAPTEKCSGSDCDAGCCFAQPQKLNTVSFTLWRSTFSIFQPMSSHAFIFGLSGLLHLHFVDLESVGV